MPDSPPDVDVSLAWQGDLRFLGQSRDQQLVIDSEGKAGPSPVTALVFSLAGCMAIDVVHILERMRTPLSRLQAHVQGWRAAEDPRRLVRVTIVFEVEGEIPEKNLRRAVDLSRDKYCSVWHSLRRDIELQISI